MSNQKFTNIVNVVISGRHEEYDFGSYKRGLQYLYDSQINYSEIILCNDSCYGPLNNFREIFEKMSEAGCDFWGLTKNSAFGWHLQSYFLVFVREVVEDKLFKIFFADVVKKENVTDVVLDYEVRLTTFLENNGYIWSSYVDDDCSNYSNFCSKNTNLTVFPIQMMHWGVELIKVKAFKFARCNDESMPSTYKQLKMINASLYSMVLSHLGRQTDLTLPIEPDFSIILPVFNRSEALREAIDSVLLQTYENWELIIVDDGSDADVEEIIKTEYFNYIKSNKIRVIRLAVNGGVCRARNIGISAARNQWITFLDSDNLLRPNALNKYANSIFLMPETKIFYGSIILKSSNSPHGSVFDRHALLEANYIDLGAMVHHRSFTDAGLRFDENMRRLVDWDYIIRLTENELPNYMGYSMIIYDDDEKSNRISTSESFATAHAYIKQKHNIPYVACTIILSYNHEKYIERAIESVCMQVVNFEHIIYIFDDASTDKTWEIIVACSRKYPGRIRACKRESNLGQGPNLRGAIGATQGDVISILEGDDYWVDQLKLEREVRFLIENPDSSMVFSALNVLDESTGALRLLDRQVNLSKTKLNAGDFLAHSSLNLFGTFSCCSFRSNIMKQLEYKYFEDRLSEIALAFFFDKFGSIGFIEIVGAVYRQHNAGLWTGADINQKKRMMIDARVAAYSLSSDKWRSELKDILKKLGVSVEMQSMPISDVAG